MGKKEHVDLKDRLAARRKVNKPIHHHIIKKSPVPLRFRDVAEEGDANADASEAKGGFKPVGRTLPKGLPDESNVKPAGPVAPKFKSAGSVPIGDVSSRAPSELMQGAEEAEMRISKAMEREAEVEKQFARVAKPATVLYSGVPLSEDLETSRDKIAEYCDREPFLLIGRESMATSPKFGIIDARFRAKSFEAVQLAIEIKEMRRDLKNGLIPASYQVRARGNEAFAERVLRVADGDMMETEYRDALKTAARYRLAARHAAGHYHMQMKRTFRELEGSLSRRALGEYAQTIWNNYALAMQKEYEYNDGVVEFLPRIFNQDVADHADPLTQRFAALGAFSAMKWICLNINEVPTYSGRKISAPSPRFLN